MAQNKLNDEATLFERIKDVSRFHILCMTHSKSERRLISTIKNCSVWINNSADTNNPPDLYSDKYKLMGDLMMVDDSGHYVINKKGHKRYVNKEREATSKLYDKLCNGDPQKFENVAALLLVADTSHIPTNEHHRFEWYRQEFKRIVEEHIESIKLYKEKFPTYKTIFFIVDESTSYIKTDILAKDVDINKGLLIEPKNVHFPFYDSEFLDVLNGNVELENGKTAGIDYVVWYMPHKFIQTNRGVMRFLPMIAVLDMSKIAKVKVLIYDAKYMISTER